ncbi:MULTISPECIES: MlaD family protein [unclassified Azospirillum]|uniref:MlaD family protein n=1 Tax=unclassified Azospirillum TaxID=2630922 RepID=UPI000B702D3A|nr:MULTISPECIES: MlaD family protein [unclassified Azospirillum]SNS17393.1 phospholipid/cholesterol/gamma-HCH transport system substrate-binding protein [Azospirillum sp. RU38E]SNS34726.1 phospholipid/cholesterol/gamma-HCH transport system substrate-binding protein [Azospirillum sp. RU37A]
METRANYTAVGAFVLALAAAAMVFVIWLAKVQFSKDYQPYYIMVSGTVTGLVQGGPVRYRGVNVGTVTDIRINPENVEEVRVTVEVPADTPIKTDAIASLEPVGVTGGVYVEIAGGSREAPLLKEKVSGIPVIPSRPSSIAAVLSRAPEVLEHLITISARLSALLNEDNQKAIGTTLANLATASGHANESIRNANLLIVDLRRQAETLSRQAETLLVTANDTVGKVGKDTGVITAQLAQTTKEINRLSASLAGMIEENREPIRDFTSTGLYDLSQLLIHLQDLTANLSRVTRRLERDPADLLFGGNSGVKTE